MLLNGKFFESSKLPLILAHSLPVLHSLLSEEEIWSLIRCTLDNCVE